MTAAPISHNAPLPLASTAPAKQSQRMGKSGLNASENDARKDAGNNTSRDPGDDFRQALRAQMASADGQLPKQPAAKNATGTTKEQPTKTVPQATRAAGAQQPSDAVDLSGLTPAPAQVSMPATVSTGSPNATSNEAPGAIAPADDKQPNAAGVIGTATNSARAPDGPALALRIAGSSANEESESAADDTAIAATAATSQSAGVAIDVNAPTGDGAKSSHGDNSQHHDGNEPAGPLATIITHNSPVSEAASTSKTDASGSVHTSDFEAELAKFRGSEPVRGAQVQITGADNQRVEIHMIERGGALSLTVRSADHALTRSLQEHAPELDARLVSAHYRAELWTPSATKAIDTSDLANGQRQPGGGSQGDKTNSNGQGQQNSKRNQQPDWLKNFEDQKKTIQQRIEYTWHQ